MAKVRTVCYVMTTPEPPILRSDEDVRHDVLHGAFTNLADQGIGEIRARHSDLRVIEHGFRVVKHHLSFHPTYRWTELNVRTCIAPGFVAFAMPHHLMQREQVLQPQPGAFSESRLFEALCAVQANVLHDTKQDVRFRVPPRPIEFQSTLYPAFDLRPPQPSQRIDSPD